MSSFDCSLPISSVLATYIPFFRRMIIPAFSSERAFSLICLLFGNIELSILISKGTFPMFVKGVISESSIDKYVQR